MQQPPADTPKPLPAPLKDFIDGRYDMLPICNNNVLFTKYFGINRGINNAHYYMAELILL